VGGLTGSTGNVDLKGEMNIRKTVLVVPRHLPKTGVEAEKIFLKKNFFFRFFFIIFYF